MDDLSFDEFLQPPDKTLEDILFEKYAPPKTSMLAQVDNKHGLFPLHTARAMFASPDPDLLLLLLPDTRMVVGSRDELTPRGYVSVLASLASGMATGGGAVVEDIFQTDSIRISSTCDFTFANAEEKRDCLHLFVFLHGSACEYHQVVRGTLFSQVVLREEQTAALTERWSEDVVDMVDHLGKTALHYACEMLPINPLLGALLQDLHADPNSLDNDLCTPLHVAARVGNAVAVVVLLRFGAEVDAKDLHERTPLFAAAMAACNAKDEDEFETYTRVLETLVERGADANAQRDTDDLNAMHYVAAHAGGGEFQLACLGALLHSPCHMDVNAVAGELQRTALHMLALQDDLALAKPVMEALVDAGARVNLGDAKGDTPLHLLLRGEKHYPFMTAERRALCSYLVSSAGARLDVANASGSNGTPGDAAKVQRISFDQELAQWRSKQEPTSIVNALVRDAALVANLPRACIAVESQAGSACVACRKPFSLISWKSNCRRCGQFFCSACTSKTVTLLQASSNNVQKEAAVCDGCFNSYCSSVSKLGAALLDVRRSREPVKPATAAATASGGGAANDLQSLWKQKEQLLGGNSAQQQQQEYQRPSAMSEATSSIQKARERMGERGERLQAVNDKTLKMKDDAENFAAMATKLRKQQENSLWPF